MIGIQHNTVIGYNGKIIGGVLHKYYNGRESSYPTSILGGILIKDIEVFDTLSTPTGVGKTIAVKDNQGKLRNPHYTIGAIGELKRSIGDVYKLVLYHPENDPHLNLCLESHKNGSSITVCYWIDEDLMKEQRWAVILDTIMPSLEDGNDIAHVAGVIIPVGDTYKYAHIKVNLVRASMEILDCQLSKVDTDLPSNTEEWRNIYTFISTNYPADERIHFYANAAFAEISDPEDEIKQIDRRLASVEISSNSRYVSR